MIVGVLTTCHTQYTSDSSTCIFLFNRTTLQVFVTYLTGALYVQNCHWTIITDWHSWNVSTRNAFSLPFAAILVNCAPSGEMHNYRTPNIIKENFENFLIHRCNYILLSQVYCVWQVVKTPKQFLITLYLFCLFGPWFITLTSLSVNAVSEKSCNFPYPPSFRPSIWIIFNASSWTSVWT